MVLPTSVSLMPMTARALQTMRRSGDPQFENPVSVGGAEFLAGPAQELASCDQLASLLGEQRPVVKRVEIRYGTKRALEKGRDRGSWKRLTPTPTKAPASFRFAGTRRALHEHDYYEGWHADLLQGLGEGPGRDVLARLAFELRHVGRTNAFPRAERLSRGCARSTWPWPVQSGLVRQRHERLCRRPGQPGTARLHQGELTMLPAAEPTIIRGRTRMLGGVTVGDTPLVSRAMDLARKHSEPFLFNHAVRSWLFAVRLGQLQDIPHDAEVVAVGSLLHDLGLTNSFTGHKRFEIEGADAARAFAREQGLDDHRVRLIWDSVALNSTPSIGLHKEVEVALCTAGIGLDYGGPQYDRIPSDEMKSILTAFPRLDMKRCFADSVCQIVKTRPESTYDNFARDFGERFVPGYKPQSTVDYLMNAPFEE